MLQLRYRKCCLVSNAYLYVYVILLTFSRFFGIIGSFLEERMFILCAST